MTEPSTADDAKEEQPGPFARAKAAAEGHALAIIVATLLVGIGAGAGGAGWFASNLIDSKSEANAATVAKLELEKLQATPLGGEEAPGAADAITRWLKSGDPRERVDALRIIGANRRREPFFVPAIAALLTDKDPNVRATAVTALGMMEDEAGVVGERISPLLRDESAEVRKAAAVALGVGWQGADEGAFPDLERLFLSPLESIRLRTHAGRAMLVVDAERGRGVLERQIEYPLPSDANLQCAALFALQTHTPGAAGVPVGGLAARTGTAARNALHSCVDAFAAYLEEPDPRYSMTNGDVGLYLTSPMEIREYGDERLVTAFHAAAAKAKKKAVRFTLTSTANDLSNFLEAERVRRAEEEKQAAAKAAR